jgi:peptidoglycan/xylan/chitin deacetylase (PgdA/CDA1 family)
MEELEMYLDNKIRIPLKTVVISLDDGIHMENSVPIVEKYKINATFFVITGSHDASLYLNSTYARFESHTDSMHNNYRCSGGNQGSQLLCEKKENIVADLKKSQEKLNGSYYFAYPFFDFNDNIINALKEAGFKMAFIGQWNTDGYSDPNTNKYLLKRETIFGDLKMDEFIDCLQ